MIAAPLVFSVIVLQALDAWTTYRILSAGGRELNRLMAGLFRRIGLVPGLILTKGGLAAMIAGLHFYGAWSGYGVAILAGICAWYCTIVLHNLRQMGEG